VGIKTCHARVLGPRIRENEDRREELERSNGHWTAVAAMLPALEIQRYLQSNSILGIHSKPDLQAHEERR